MRRSSRPREQPSRDRGNLSRVACLSAISFWLVASPATLSGQEVELPEALSRAIEEMGERPPAGQTYQQRVEELQKQGATDFAELARLLSLLGRYDELIELEVAGAPAAIAAEVALRQSQALTATGRRAEAREILQELSTGGSQFALSARVELAELALHGGRRDEAEGIYYSLIDAYNARSSLTSVELEAVGVACQQLGRNDPELFKDALKAFDEAIAADRNNLSAKVRVGDLFVEKYDSFQARESVTAVLGVEEDHPQALLAMARIHHFDGSPAARELTERALEVNPNFVEARVFLTQLLLQLEQKDEAKTEAEKALEVDSQSLAAMALLAASHYLADDREQFETVRDEALQINSQFAELYNDLADSCVQNRLYPQARDFAKLAVEVDPKSWRGHSLLGLNQLRLGEMDEGRASLERSFAGDPYNVWVKNTLDLLDKLDDYETATTERFVIVAHREEADLLIPYVGELSERAYDVLSERYSYSPPTPIRIEIYRGHEDFSVRTVGLAGLGALGVSFGPVVALDSPAARGIGEFNWGTTLWHEIAHTFTLGVTDSRIPRWLTEGLSVYDERLGRPSWEDDVRPEFLQAYRDGMLLGLEEINKGFVRPSFPTQIQLSYFQASLICELIEKEHGWDTMLAILAGYRDRKPTDQIFREVLGEELAEFDKRFFAFLDERFAASLPSFGPSDGRALEEEEPDLVSEAPSGEDGEDSLSRTAKEKPNDFRTQLHWGRELKSDEKYEQALDVLEHAKQLFPEYVGAGSPYHLRAEIFEERGDIAKAAVELQQLIDFNEYAFDEHIKLASLYKELNEPESEAEVLDRVTYIYPYDVDVHLRLAELSEGLGRLDEAVLERRAVVALGPPSRADALYRLALALDRAGRGDEARREVLKALELAPALQPAQELLVKLVSGASS